MFEAPKKGDLPDFSMPGDAGSGVSQSIANELSVHLDDFNVALNALDGEIANANKQADLMEQVVGIISKAVTLVGDRVVRRAGAAGAGPDLDRRLTRSIGAVAKQDPNLRNFAELAAAFFPKGG